MLKILTWVLRLAGILCLLWVCFSAFRDATIPVYQGNGSSTQFFYLIQTNRDLVLALFIQTGQLWYMAAGLLLLGLTSHHVRVAYWCVQIAIWLCGITLWYQVNTVLFVLPPHPEWLLVPLCISLIALIAYKAMITTIGKLMNSMLVPGNAGSR